MGRISDPKTEVPAGVAGTRDVAGTEPDRAAEVNVRPEFVPLRLATGRERTSLFIIGPLLWVAAVMVVAFFVRHGDAVGIALAVLAGSVLLALVVLLPMRARRVRNESER